MNAKLCGAVSSFAGILAVSQWAQAVVVYADNTPVFRDTYEEYLLNATPKFALQGDYDLFEGSAITQNAAPLANEGDQYMYLIRQPELNMRANFRDAGFNHVAVNVGQNLHAEFALYADLSEGNSPNPMNLQFLSNFANLELALVANVAGTIDYFRPGGDLVAGTVPWQANKWQIWKIDHVVGSTVLTLSIDGTVGTFNFAGNPVSVGLTSLRFTGRTANNDRYAVDAVNPKWIVNGSGDWSPVDNWDGGTPDGAEAVANFTDAITSPATVTLDSPRTVGTVRFDNANSYTIAGASTLTIDKDFGGAVVEVVQGSHAITTPVSIIENVTVTANPSAVLTISGPVSVAAGMTVNKDGGGTLVQENLRMPTLNVNGGTVRVSPKESINDPAGTSVLNAFDVTAAATLDLTNNALIIDYSASDPSPQDRVRQMLETGLSGSAGIISSSAAADQRLGYGEKSVLGLAEFAGQTLDSEALVIGLTFAGDANLDGKVDVGDLGALASNWQQAAVWTGGDFDYNGTVNVGDLGLLATNWQKGAAGAGPALAETLQALGLPGAAVPEPGAAVVGLFAAGLLAVRRSRTRIP